MLYLSMQSNLTELQKSLNNFVNKQLPFAIATALTETAKKVKEAETKKIKDTFKSPTPFTAKSIRIKAARKTNLEAVVFMMDRTASYLDPYEFGGVHRLNSKALLNPKDIKLNAYGQLSRGALAALKGRPDVFIGPVKTSKGVINGVWQRVTDTKKVTLLNAKGKRLRGLNKATTGKDGKTVGHLKLLLRFGDALPVKQHLDYRKIAKAVVAAEFAGQFDMAVKKAIATARK
jgi:hypothetical protein